MSIRLKLMGARISFAQGLNNTSAVAGGKPKYSVDFLLVPGTKILEKTPAGWKPVKDMDTIIQRVAVDTWKTEAAAKRMLASLEASKLCYRDGDKRTKGDGTPYEGYPGVWYVTAKNETRPKKWAKDGTLLDAADTSIYSGCKVVGLVDIYGNARAEAKGIFASLLGAQFMADDDAFAGGAPVAQDDIDDLSDVGETESMID